MPGRVHSKRCVISLCLFSLLSSLHSIELERNGLSKRATGLLPSHITQTSHIDHSPFLLKTTVRHVDPGEWGKFHNIDASKDMSVCAL